MGLSDPIHPLTSVTQPGEQRDPEGLGIPKAGRPFETGSRTALARGNLSAPRGTEQGGGCAPVPASGGTNG